MIYLAILLYTVAMIAANLIVAAFGPWTIPFNAFFLIGLDLALRDLLHTRLHRWQMLLLIVATGALTFALNPSAGMIAVASSAAFLAAALSDYAVFAAMRGSWLLRSNASNVAGALVDSLLFPLIAFGGIDPRIAGSMFVAKVAGAAVWSICFNAFRK